MRDAPIAPLRDAVRENVELLGDWGADVVMFDWLFVAAAVAAEHAGIPAVALVHCPYPLPVRGAPPLFSGQKPMAGRVGAARDGLLNVMTRRFSAAGLPMLNDVRAEHGLTPLEDWNDQIRSVRAIYVMTAPELDFSSTAELPPNVRYVGPAFEPFEKEWESLWPSENADPLVLISFSTSYMNQRALAQRVLDAVAGLRVRALLTAGPALDLNQLRIPDNARFSSVAIASRWFSPTLAMRSGHQCGGSGVWSVARVVALLWLCRVGADDCRPERDASDRSGVGMQALGEGVDVHFLFGGYPGSHDPGQQAAGEIHGLGDRLLANSNRDFAVEVQAGLQAGFGKRRGQPHSHVRLRAHPAESAINPLAEPLRRWGMRPGHQEPLRYRRPRAHAHLREHDHPTGAYVACRGPHRRGRVTLVHQHEPPDQRVERVTGELDVAKVTEHELDVLDVRLGRALMRPRERLLVTLDPDHRTVGAD